MLEAPTINPRKVLLVDGEAILREVYTEEARRAGLEPLVAAHAEEAWRIFEDEQPDVVVTDLDLPGDESGAQLIQRMRATPLGAVIPVIAVSPGKRRIRGVTDAVILHDVDDFLDKPVHGERLLWRINELVEGRPIGVHAQTGGVSQLDRAVSFDRSLDFLQGRLEARDVGTLFFSFFATSRSGKLCVMEGKEVIQVWFHRGWPVFAETNVDGVEFSQWLVRRGKVDGDAMAEARTEWMDVDRGLGVVLISRGAIGARTMFEETRANVDAVIGQLFSWTAGNYYVEYSQNPSTYRPPETVSLQRSPTHYVVTGVREHYSRARCTEILSTAQGRLEVADSAHFILRELLDPYYYENVIAQLGPGGTAPKLLQMHPFSSDDDALRALCALWVVGGVVEKISAEQLRRVRRSTASQADKIREAVASAANREHPDVKAARDARIRARLDRRKQRAAERRLSDVASIMTALDKVSAEVAYENGVKLLARRRYEEAARTLDEAVRLAPHQATWYSTLAQAYLAQDNAGPEELDAALQTLKRGAALDPRNGEPYHWLGMVLMRMGHPDEARITLRRSIELGSPHAEQSRALLESLG